MSYSIHDHGVHLRTNFFLSQSERQFFLSLNGMLPSSDKSKVKSYDKISKIPFFDPARFLHLWHDLALFWRDLTKTSRLVLRSNYFFSEEWGPSLIIKRYKTAVIAAFIVWSVTTSSSRTPLATDRLANLRWVARVYFVLSRTYLRCFGPFLFDHFCYFEIPFHFVFRKDLVDHCPHFQNLN